LSRSSRVRRPVREDVESPALLDPVLDRRGVYDPLMTRSRGSVRPESESVSRHLFNPEPLQSSVSAITQSPESPRPRARVFLSSGQRKGTTATRLMEAAAGRIQEELGFEATVGSQRTQPAGVPEDVSRRLEAAEYFVLVDFDLWKESTRKEEGRPRHSVYSHQEFAIAVHLRIDYLLLAEEGLPEPEGLYGYVVHQNPVRFTRADLPQVLVDAVRAKTQLPSVEERWSNDWRRELRICRSLAGTNNPDGWVLYGSGQFRPLAKYFLAEVSNLHRTLAATDVHAYLERVVDRRTLEERHLPSLPLKWNALSTESTAIPPRTTTGFSAFLMFNHEPGAASIGVNRFLIDTNTYDDLYRISGPGSYDLHFAVFSREFAPARKRLVLELRNGPDESRLIDPDLPNKPIEPGASPQPAVHE
jgi:hypothetical protein